MKRKDACEIALQTVKCCTSIKYYHMKPSQTAKNGTSLNVISLDAVSLDASLNIVSLDIFEC